MSNKVSSRRWADGELEADRQKAIDIFIEKRLGEETKDYVEKFYQSKDLVEQLFRATNNLLDFRGEVFEEEPKLVEPARYLGGPPISQDDIDTLARGSITRRKKIPLEVAEKAAKVIQMVWDPVRFPWVQGRRPPTDEERAKAIEWTAGLWAVQRFGTERRMESSARQEKATIDILKNEGWNRDLDIQEIQTAGDLDNLSRGTFATHVYVKGAECDIPVRLQDDRLLAIECKASNSSLNSIKRLIRETGGKAKLWQSEFGKQVITGAVLSGVYRLKNLKDAQEEFGIAIFWEHNLEPLRDFLRNAK